MREGDVPLLAVPALLEELQAAAGVVERRLAPAEHGVDAGDLPLPASEMARLADLAPVVSRSVRCVQHRVVLCAGSLGLLEQRPDLVEEVDAELAVVGHGSPTARRISRPSLRATGSWRPGR